MKCVLIVVAGGLLGLVAYDVTEEKEEKEVRATKFVLTDSEGAPRLEITCEDGPRIRMWDTSKNRFVDLYVDDTKQDYGLKITDKKDRSDMGLSRHWR